MVPGRKISGRAAESDELSIRGASIGQDYAQPLLGAVPIVGGKPSKRTQNQRFVYSDQLADSAT